MSKTATNKPKILAVVGPTASGKSALAISLAKKFKGEIISADSRQVYRGMDIGTGKVTKHEMRSVPHHMLSILSPKRTFNAGLFQKRAEAELQKILKRGKLPIICGGTGFYIDALIYNYKLPETPKDAALRSKLAKESPERLFARLKKLDPERAKNIDQRNKVRLIRSLEIVMKTGEPLPRLKKKSDYEVLKIGIALSAEELRRKIQKRTAGQFRSGMVSEVKNLKKKGLSSKRLEELGLEYRWVNHYLDGKITREEMLNMLDKEIWHYAKRQMTWFKRDKETHWVKSEKEAERLVRKFLSF